MSPRNGLGVTLMGGDVASAAWFATEAERRGFRSAWTAEFYDRSAAVSLAAMAAATSEIRLGSGIMYAFGRSPMLLAAEARDLDQLSGGRLVLGLGTGTPAQMRDWHGLDPAHLAPRVEELVPLLRRLWNLDQGAVAHEGRFYRVKLQPVLQMQPPARREVRIYLAGVNSRMVEAAGRVCDGLVGHPLFSPEYVSEVVRPALAAGAAARGLDRPLPIAGYVMCSVAGREEEARAAAAAQIAFYAVVRTYDPIIALHGFHDEAAAIRQAFRAADWRAAVNAVSDRMLETFAVFGTPSTARQRFHARFEGVYDEPLLFPPSVGAAGPPPRELTTAVLDAFAMATAM